MEINFIRDRQKTCVLNNKLSMYLFIAILCLLSCGEWVLGAPYTSPTNLGSDWRITFFTGDKVWAGTDSDIFVQVHGTLANSRTSQLNPHKTQLEAQGVDTFSLGQLDLSLIGQIKSVTVIKQHSYAFLNDWHLDKVEVTEPSGRKYLFNCNCWLTTRNFKRTIQLTSVDGIDADNGLGEIFALSPGKTYRAFPMTIGLLFLLLILVVITYFGNVMCKKWKQNVSLLFASNRRARAVSENRSSRRSGGGGNHRPSRARSQTERATTSNNNQNASDLFKDDDEESNSQSAERAQVYNFTNDLNGVVNRPSHLDVFPSYARNTLEDKPPDYKELFPLKTLDANLTARDTVVSSAPNSANLPVTMTLENNSDSIKLSKV